MKSHRKVLIVVFAATFTLLSACTDASDKSSDPVDDQSQHENATHDDSSDTSESPTQTEENNTDAKDGADNEDAEEKADHHDQKKEDDLATNLKETYLKKLDETKAEFEEKKDNLPDGGSTYVLTNFEGDRFEVWDGLLNEIYGVLKKQLPADEMDQLRKEQRAWIDHRDRTAKEASLKYEGGTLEQVEYTATMNNLTQERCYELVEKYMGEF